MCLADRMLNIVTVNSTEDQKNMFRKKYAYCNLSMVADYFINKINLIMN